MSFVFLCSPFLLPQLSFHHFSRHTLDYFCLFYFLLLFSFVLSFVSGFVSGFFFVFNSVRCLLFLPVRLYSSIRSFLFEVTSTFHKNVGWLICTRWGSFLSCSFFFLFSLFLQNHLLRFFVWPTNAVIFYDYASICSFWLFNERLPACYLHSFRQIQKAFSCSVSYRHTHAHTLAPQNTCCEFCSSFIIINIIIVVDILSIVLYNVLSPLLKPLLV